MFLLVKAPRGMTSGQALLELEADVLVQGGDLPGVFRRRPERVVGQLMVTLWDQQFVQATSSDSPNRSAQLANLGAELRDRYERIGELADLEAAISAYQQALQTTLSDAPSRPALLNSLGLGLRNHYAHTGALADLEAAITAYQQALQTILPDASERSARLNNLETDSLGNLASLYVSQGKYEQAEVLYQRVLDISPQQLEANDSYTTTILSNLASLYVNQGKYEQAEPLLQRALAIREQVLGSQHPDTAITLHNLAVLYKSQGKYEQASLLLKLSSPSSNENQSEIVSSTQEQQES